MSAARDLHTRVCDNLGCRHPVLQAGMGGVARSELVAAVTAAAGYGLLGMVRESPELIVHDYRKQRRLAARSEDAVYTDASAINGPPHTTVRVIANSPIETLNGQLPGNDPAQLAPEVVAEEGGRPVYRFQHRLTAAHHHRRTRKTRTVRRTDCRHHQHLADGRRTHHRHRRVGTGHAVSSAR